MNESYEKRRMRALEVQAEMEQLAREQERDLYDELMTKLEEAGLSKSYHDEIVLTIDPAKMFYCKNKRTGNYELRYSNPAASLSDRLKTSESNPCKENTMSDIDRGTVVSCYSDASGYVPMSQYTIDQAMKIVKDLRAQIKADEESELRDVPAVQERIKQREAVIQAFRDELSSRLSG